MKKKMLGAVIVFVLCIIPIVVFADPSHWAAGAVRDAIRADLVPAHLQSGFQQPITRAEFSALAVALYEHVRGREIKVRMFFADTNDINVQKMGGLGVIQGVGGGNFDPNGRLTREQAAVMLVRLAYAMGNRLPAVASTFSDSAFISPWAIQAAGQIQAAGIMGGTGNNMFSPSGAYTREQSIVAMLLLLDVIWVDVHLSSQGLTNERLATMVANGEIPANVTHLDLRMNYITDISPLSNLTNLVMLNLWGSSVTCLSPLSGLSNLIELNIWGNQFDSIVPLSNLTSLKVLSIGDNINFDGNISALGNLTNLRELAIWSGQIRNYSTIANLTQLEQLSIGGAMLLEDLSFLNALVQLTGLSIHGAPNIQNFSPIGNLPKLSQLDIQSSELMFITLLPLSNLVNLTELGLFNNGLIDISELRHLTMLTKLILSYNHIVDITPLGDMKNLELLILSNNQITDITPLLDMANLHGLFLTDNPLCTTQIEKLEVVFDDIQLVVD